MIEMHNIVNIVATTLICCVLLSASQADPIVLMPTAEQQPARWRYTTDRPSDDWIKTNFDDSSWKQGPAGFGTVGTPAAVVGTIWNTSDIWLRTTFNYDGRAFEKVDLRVHFDEDTTVYLNGQKIASLVGYTSRYGQLDATGSIRKALRKGTNTLATTCHQTYGGQYIDLGIILDSAKENGLSIRIPGRIPTNSGPLPPIKPLFDHAVRDTSICVDGDGMYYLTGTTANNPAGGHDKTGWWYVNEGIRIWKSKELVNWEPLGLVWSLDADATWAKEFKTDERGTCRRALWAPDIHFINGTFWITYSMNYGGCGLLKSTTGKADGPYIDVKKDGPLTGQIDASLFQDDDGKVYWVYQNGKVARMNDDMTGLVEEPRLLKPSDHKHVGFEGAYLTKRNGRYYLICADFIAAQYHCMVAESDKVYGPYGARYMAIPHGGHNMFFTDTQGRWWATFFGNDGQAPFRERPAILRIELDEEGRVRAVQH
jgi:xylan 1,4-beta-xylosidase